MELLNIPRQQNIKFSTIAYTHVNSRKLRPRLHLIHFTTKHRERETRIVQRGEKGRPVLAKNKGSVASRLQP